MIKQSQELLRFFSALNVDYNNKVYVNTIDSTSNYITRFYTPNLTVTPLSNVVLGYINEQVDIQEGLFSIDTESIIYLVNQSDLRISSPYIFKLIQSVTLDAFSIVYALEEKPLLLKYVEESDLRVTVENIGYIVDALSGQSAYTEITAKLQDLYIALGYLASSLDAIKKDVLTDG